MKQKAIIVDIDGKVAEFYDEGLVGGYACDELPDDKFFDLLSGKNFIFSDHVSAYTVEAQVKREVLFNKAVNED